MSRIADARARAGRAVAVDSAIRWEQERENAATLLGVTTPSALNHARNRPLVEVAPNQELAPAPTQELAPSPNQEPAPRADRPDSLGFELSAMVRRMFISPPQAIRSVLFCTVPGEPMSTIAWRVAELLVLYSGKRLAFVDDAAGITTAPTVPGQRWITRIDRQSGTDVADLLSSFHFVICNAMPSPDNDFVRMALAVDGVIVVLTEGQTERSAVGALVEQLRSHDVNLLGVVLASRPPATPRSLFTSAD